MISTTLLGASNRRGGSDEAARVGVRFDGWVFATALDVADTLLAEPLVSTHDRLSCPKDWALVSRAQLSLRLPLLDVARQPLEDIATLEVAPQDGVGLHGRTFDVAAVDVVAVVGATFAPGLCRGSESDGGLTRVLVICGPGPERELDEELSSRVLPGRKPTLPRGA
ncbi:MAG: hypothetical protein JXM70_00880 [Pirellulales bacterium]|nr:hypothetical protein [Pirellulales bacterium]